MFYFAFIIVLKKISLTCFKTDSEKNEEIHDRDTKYFILKIYVINFTNYICHQMKVQKEPPVVFFK